VVCINRCPVYLGAWGSPEAQAGYGKLLADLAQGKFSHGASVPVPVGLTVADILLRYFQEHLPRYAKDEQHCQRGAIRVLRELYGETPAADFGPLRLRVVREAKVKKNWSRGYMNHQVKRLQFMFRWAVGCERVPSTDRRRDWRFSSRGSGVGAAVQRRRVGDVGGARP
jgi:hypothetical protein